MNGVNTNFICEAVTLMKETDSVISVAAVWRSQGCNSGKIDAGKVDKG